MVMGMLQPVTGSRPFLPESPDVQRPAAPEGKASILNADRAAEADELVAEALDAMQAGLDRRYALEIGLLGEEALSLAGTVDVDGRGHVVLTLETAGLVPFDRVLVGRDPVNPDKLKSAPFPAEMVAKFTGS